LVSLISRKAKLGDIVYVDISTKGQEVAEHQIFGTVEAVKTVSDLYMPISGKVVDVNPALDASPEKVNSDPYGDGWMIKIELTGKHRGCCQLPSIRNLLGSKWCSFGARILTQRH